MTMYMPQLRKREKRRREKRRGGLRQVGASVLQAATQLENITKYCVRFGAIPKRKFLCLPASVFTDLSAMTTPSVLDDLGGGV